MNNKKTQNKSDTIKLATVLAIGVIIMIILAVALINSLKTPTGAPEPTHIEIENINGISLSDAKAILENADIQYEVIPTQSRIANRVEKVDFMGDTAESGKLLVTIGTVVKLYANEMGADKVVYLTFDDGPTQDNTDYILETLAKYNIKATFFVEGYDVTRYPDKILATFEAGHAIGCHSYSHVFADVYSSTDSFMSEVNQYEEALKNALGEGNYSKVEKLVRFPGGTNNSLILEQEPMDYVTVVRESGYRIYDWTALTGDTEGKTETNEMISHMMNTLNKAKSKNEPLIVLLHDKWPVKENDSLSSIIDKLIEEGYYFDTVDNCPEYVFVEN